MNEYDDAVIKNIRKFKGKGDTIYACLYSEAGELLISATLDYIVEALKERMTKDTDK